MLLLLSIFALNCVVLLSQGPFVGPFFEILRNLGHYIIFLSLAELFFCTKRLRSSVKMALIAGGSAILVLGCQLLAMWPNTLYPSSASAAGHEIIGSLNPRISSQENIAIVQITAAGERLERKVVEKLSHETQANLVMLSGVLAADAPSVCSEAPGWTAVISDAAYDEVVCLLSKFELEPNSQLSLGNESPAALIASVKLEQGAKIRVLLVDAELPFSKSATSRNRLLYRRALTQFKHANDMALVVGGFEATIFSSFYSGWVANANFSNALSPVGLLKTWPVGNPLARFQVDHILYRGEGIKVVEARTLRNMGLSHYPLFVRLSL